MPVTFHIYSYGSTAGTTPHCPCPFALLGRRKPLGLTTGKARRRNLVPNLPTMAHERMNVFPLFLWVDFFPPSTGEGVSGEGRKVRELENCLHFLSHFTFPSHTPWGGLFIINRVWVGFLFYSLLLHLVNSSFAKPGRAQTHTNTAQDFTIHLIHLPVYTGAFGFGFSGFRPKWIVPLRFLFRAV